LLLAGSWYLLGSRHLLAHFVATAMQYCVLVFLYMTLYLHVGITNPEFKTMYGFDTSRLPGNIQIFLSENRGGEGIKYVWDLKTRIEDWDAGAVKAIIESGRPVAVIAASDSYREIADKVAFDVELEVIGSFDYDENRPQKRKTLLVLARPKN
jgi:hypothetical protein